LALCNGFCLLCYPDKSLCQCRRCCFFFFFFFFFFLFFFLFFLFFFFSKILLNIALDKSEPLTCRTLALQRNETAKTTKSIQLMAYTTLGLRVASDIEHTWWENRNGVACVGRLALPCRYILYHTHIPEDRGTSRRHGFFSLPCVLEPSIYESCLLGDIVIEACCDTALQHYWPCMLLLPDSTPRSNTMMSSGKTSFHYSPGLRVGFHLSWERE